MELERKFVPDLDDDLYWARMILIATAIFVVAIIGKGLLPQRAQIQEHEFAIQGLRLEVAEAKKNHHELERLQRETIEQKQAVQNLFRLHAEGSAYVWLPKVAAEHFQRSQIATSSIRMNTTQPDAKIPGIVHAYAGVAIPLPDLSVKLKGLFLSVADLEERNPGLRVTDFSIIPSPDDPTQRTVCLNIEALDRE